MKIALALSGGGHRAAVFHLGVLRFFAEKKLLEQVAVISTTSGGSILAAQLFQQKIDSTASDKTAQAELAWPTSEQFLTTSLAQAEALIVNESLENSFIKRMFWPSNWRKWGHRANLMAKVIKTRWGISTVMRDLPQTPHWIINGATNITGSRWFVQKVGADSKMGSDDIGLSDANEFAIADAVAISAAYPGVIGPYCLNTRSFSWHYAKNREDNKQLLQSKKGLYLSDGGLYDNLGIEPLFNLEQSSLAYPDTNFLVVSDAGSGLKRQRLAPVWRPLLRTIRLINVINQQVRELRLRTLLAFFNKNPNQGLYIPMGLSFAQWQKDRELKDSSIKDEAISKMLTDYDFLAPAEVWIAKNTPTSLASLSTEQFNRLVRHGYESALLQFVSNDV
jgi:NTE family protein